MERKIITCMISSVLIVFAGCGSGGSSGGHEETPPPEEQQTLGVLTGKVAVGPLCPVEPCNPSPEQIAQAYSGRSVMVFRDDGITLVREVSIDASGYYRVEMSPGIYVIDINHTGIDSSKDLPRQISIITGQTVVLDIDIDTGIR